MTISISSGKYDVIENGIVIADSWNSEIEFHVDANAILKFDIILKFIETSDGKQNFTKEVKDNKITFECVNFGNSTGTAYPLEIATIVGKKMYLNFRNYGEKDVMRKIEYTFYIER